MRFRSEVRNFALSVEDEATRDSKMPQRKRPQPDRLPLLKACDALRDDLMPLGVQIKVRNPHNKTVDFNLVGKVFSLF